MVATGPVVGVDGVSVHHDARLVRSAILYADQVELISPGTFTIAALASAAEQGHEFVFDLMAGMDDTTLRHLGYEGDVDELQTTMAWLQQLKAMSRADRRQLLGADADRQVRELVRGLTDNFLDGEEGMKSVVARMWDAAGAPDLAIAVDAGLLTLATDAFDVGADTDTQVEQFAAKLRQLIADPASHLLFDELTADLVAAMVRDDEAEMHPLAAVHTRRAATGAGLIAHLPAFPDSPMETVLEARTELGEPLLRYRKGVADLSAKLTSGPLERALAAEVTDLWHDEVQPTLADLERDLSHTRLARSAVSNLVTDAKAVLAGVAGVGGLVFGVGSVSELAAWATAGGAAAGGYAVKATADAARQAVESRENARTHDLYYLLAANDRLR